MTGDGHIGGEKFISDKGCISQRNVFPPIWPSPVISRLPPTSFPRSTMSGRVVLLVTLQPYASYSNSTQFPSLSFPSGSYNIVITFAYINSISI